MFDKEFILLKKSYRFSLMVSKECKKININSFNKIYINQILRSSTSIGANISEAVGASSFKDLVNKLNISIKEARESYYWLRLMIDLEIINSKISYELLDLNQELIKLLFVNIRIYKSKIKQ